ncbi:MAG: histidine kinase dimerization/phospho-acceptor domain-containing protein [Geminicoccaceae bacterium]
MFRPFKRFRTSIAWRLRSALVIGTTSILSIAWFQIHFDTVAERNIQSFVDDAVPASLATMTMLLKVSELNVDLLAHAAGDTKARSGFEEHLAEFRKHRASVSATSLHGEAGRLDDYLEDIVSLSRDRVFDAYDPGEPESSGNAALELERGIFAPLRRSFEELIEAELEKTGDIDARMDRITGIFAIERAVVAMSTSYLAHGAGDREAAGRFQVAFDAFGVMLDAWDSGEPLHALAEIRRIVDELHGRATRLFRSHNPDARKDILTAIAFIERYYFQPARETLQIAFDRILNNIDENRDRLATKLDFTTRFLQVTSLCTLVIFIVFAFHFDRKLVRPILHIEDFIERMRTRRPVDGIPFEKRPDEIGAIQESLLSYNRESCELERLRAEQLRSVEREHHSELHRAYEKLKNRKQDLDIQTDRLRRANAELERFVSISSHDLREPLKNILGLCRLLQTGDTRSADMDVYLEKIIASASRMGALIDDLRSLTRLDQNRVEREIRPLNGIIDSVIEEHRMALDERGAETAFVDLPTLDCFPNILWQLFDNLVRNALRHGAVRLRIVIALRDDPQGGPQIIVFTNNRDNGEQAGDELLLPFRKGHASPECGTGIGLSIVRKAVDMHGGRIWIECPRDGDFSVCFTLKGLNDD